MGRNRIYQKLTGLSFFLMLALILGGCGPYYGSDEARAMLEQYYPPAALKALTESPVPEISIIDVRSFSAYEGGHISTALSFPSSEIESRLSELSPDQYLIVHCETGGRAQLVITDVLEPKGYTRFMNWGGIYRWLNAGPGFDLVTGPNPTE